MAKLSPRQELKEFSNNGNLRASLEGRCGLSFEAIDLLVNIALRYCDPPTRKRKKY